MKTFKNMTLAVLCTAALSSVAQNTDPSVPQHISKLTSNQEATILNAEYHCSAAMKNATSTEAKDSIRKKSESQIKAALSPDQYTQYKKIKKSMPADDIGSN